MHRIIRTAVSSQVYSVKKFVDHSIGITGHHVVSYRIDGESIRICSNNNAFDEWEQ